MALDLPVVISVRLWSHPRLELCLRPLDNPDRSNEEKTCVMALTTIPDIASIKSYEGKSLGTTEWIVVSQEQIQAFAEATGDHQWIHVDVERAEKESPFGGPIAHGYLTIGLAPALLPELLEVKNASRTVNYGIDKMRLPTAVPAGARVNMSAEVKHVRVMRGDAARVTFSLTFHVEGVTRPCCSADVIYVYFP
jgi:acyl dehydratase